MRRFGAVIVVVALGLSACGGSGKSSSTTRTSAASAERTRLLNSLRSAMQQPSSPLAGVPDLDECIVQQVGKLPLPQLRQASASNTGAPITARAAGQCISQGKGVSWVRGVIIKAGAGNLPPPIPASYKKCVLASVNTIGPKQLGPAFSHAASGDESYARRLGQQLGLACLRKPGVFAAFRAPFLASIRRALQGHHLPAPFVQCVPRKAGQIHPDQLVKLIQAGPAAQNAYGQKLGRQCRSAISS